MPALTRDQESSLVADAKADPDAFGDLYEYYLPKIYRFVYYRTGNKHEAEDVVAQTFLQAIESLPGYEEMCIRDSLLTLVCPKGCFTYCKISGRGSGFFLTSGLQFGKQVFVLNQRT